MSQPITFTGGYSQHQHKTQVGATGTEGSGGVMEMDSKQPMVIDKRTSAYALVGTQKCLENTANAGAQRAHLKSQRELQQLLEEWDD